MRACVCVRAYVCVFVQRLSRTNSCDSATRFFFFWGGGGRETETKRPTGKAKVVVGWRMQIKKPGTRNVRALK